MGSSAALGSLGCRIGRLRQFVESRGPDRRLDDGRVAAEGPWLQSSWLDPGSFDCDARATRLSAQDDETTPVDERQTWDDKGQPMATFLSLMFLLTATLMVAGCSHPGFATAKPAGNVFRLPIDVTMMSLDP